MEIGAGKEKKKDNSSTSFDTVIYFCITISPFKTWQRVYSYDLTFNLTETEAQNVLGGEVAMWTEQTDEASLDIRLW